MFSSPMSIGILSFWAPLIGGVMLSRPLTGLGIGIVALATYGIYLVQMDHYLARKEKRGNTV